MTEQSTISFDYAGEGTITMVGEGPWRAVSCGSTFEVRDSAGRVANPTVVQKWSTVTKPNSNVIFARPAITSAIVSKANELLLGAAE